MPSAAAVTASPKDRAHQVVGSTMTPRNSTMTTVVTAAIAKDAILGWYRGEFAAANAIIDALCGHLSQLSEEVSDYRAVFAAIHRRRLNWIPVLQMQKYHSIGDVALELKKVTSMKKIEKEVNQEDAEEVQVFSDDRELDEAEEVQVFSDERELVGENVDEIAGINEKVLESVGNGDGGIEVVAEEDFPDCEVTDSVSQDMQPSSADIDNIRSNHEDCEARPAHIKLTKGFSAKEPVKGHTVNVVKGLKLYEDVYTDAELLKLNDFVDELRLAGQNGELSGETFILFNQQVKGNRRELIQFGIPIFGQIREEAANNGQSSNIEPIPALLEDVIDHLLQWQLIPEYKKPNGCIINFFEEGEHSQPFQKPPHLDQPISTLFLSESTMAFGRTLVSDNEGNYKGPLMLSLKEGTLLVMRGNSADMARHVICASANKRISITFYRVRPDSNQTQSPPTPIHTSAMNVFQPGIPSAYGLPLQNGSLYSYKPMDLTPKLGILHAPIVMLAPLSPVVLSPTTSLPHGGTGVFLPWTVGSRKHAKHLPPRARKGRFLTLPSPIEKHVAESNSEPTLSF